MQYHFPYEISQRMSEIGFYLFNGWCHNPEDLSYWFGVLISTHDKMREIMDMIEFFERLEDSN